MSDFDQQLRQHYERQKLPPAKVDALLSAGRTASARRSRARQWVWAAAACGVLALILFAAGRIPRTEIAVDRITVADTVEAVRAHFSRPDYALDTVSADHDELRTRLIAAGAPPEFSIPEAMTALSSYGCMVLDVRGRRIYLICFFLDDAGPRSADTAPMRQSTVTGPDGSMMKKDRPLVHLLVADRQDFSDPPPSGAWLEVPAAEGWLVRARSDEARVVVLATQVTATELEAALGVL